MRTRPLPPPVMLPDAGIGLRHPHYQALLEERPPLGFVELHSENFFGDGGAALAVLDAVRQHYPVSLHGVGLSLGSAAGLDPWHLARLQRLVQRVGPVRVSDHACFARAQWAPPGAPGRDVHAADLLPVPLTDEALAVMQANVDHVQEFLGRPILVENLSAYLTLAGAEWHEADFLVALARRTGCGLLLDVNNLYVNALNARLAGDAGDPLDACRQWLDRVPPGLVGEIHLAGHQCLPDIVIDDHGSRVAEPVWALYGYALQRLGPVPTLVEWDTDIPPLQVLLDEAAHAQALVQAHAGAGVTQCGPLLEACA